MLVYCGQTVGWIKIPLCTAVGLGTDVTVLDGDQLPLYERGTAAAPTFRSMSIVAKRSIISATAELLLNLACDTQSSLKPVINYTLETL